MSYRNAFKDAIARLNVERRYRVFADLERNPETFPIARWRRSPTRIEDVVIWCSNDYLAWVATRR